MSLTVPTAGTTGGRAAQPQFEAPQTGAVLAQFGDTVRALGDRIETQRLDTQMTELQLGMTRDMNALRLKYEAMGDPDAIDAGWAADSKALKEAYLEGTAENGRPRVDPKIRSQFGFAFDDLAERHAFSLGTRNLAIRQSQTLVAGIEYANEASKTAAASDAATRDTIYAQNDQRLDREVRQGLKTPEDAAKEKISFREKGDGLAAFQMLQDDPKGLIDHLDAGELPGLSAEDRVQYRAKADGAIAMLAEKDAKAAEVQRDKDVAVVKADLTDGVRIMSQGLPWTGEARLDDPAIKEAAPELWAQAKGAQALRDNRKSIDQMTPAELKATRAEIAAPGFDKPWQTEMVGVLDQRIIDAEKEWGQDGIAAAKKAGLAVPELPDFDPANPAAFVRGLGERSVFAGWAVKSGYAPSVPLMDATERAKLKDAIGIVADPAARAAAATALIEGAGPAAEAVAKSADASGVFTYALGLIRTGEAPDMAFRMLRGEAKRDRKTVILPADKDLRTVFDDATGGIFGDDPASNADVLDAATALYADSATGLDPDEVKAGWTGDGQTGRAFRAAIQQALGGTPDASGNYTVGGVQDVGGQMVVLPPGVSARAANIAWENLGHQLGGRSDLMNRGENFDPLIDPGPIKDTLRGLKAASIGGKQVPQHGANLWSHYQDGLTIEAFGPDRYTLSYERNGQKIYVENSDGGTFTFSMRALIRETGQ